MSHLFSDGEAQAFLDMGITASEVVRFRYPDVNEKEADHLLWEHTPYPLVSGFHDLADRLPGLQCNCPSSVMVR